jgi:outer membrane protein OmpA-like peptidoglycan-associated protein
MRNSLKVILALVLLLSVGSVMAQDSLPRDNGIYNYHNAPRYRDSESHPLRTLAYIFHPIGWALREGIYRPMSYFVSSSETKASIFGYREPHDYREPECFSADASVPDCKAILPFDYDTPNKDIEPTSDGEVSSQVSAERHVYMPDVNFDFNKNGLNELGRGKVRQIAKLLQASPGVQVVLEGHADQKGTDQYNNGLAQNRADAVKNELIAVGVPADRIQTVTFGKSKPIFEDNTEWARAVNRRVEVRLN